MIKQEAKRIFTDYSNRSTKSDGVSISIADSHDQLSDEAILAIIRLIVEQYDITTEGSSNRNRPNHSQSESCTPAANGFK